MTTDNASFRIYRVQRPAHSEGAGAHESISLWTSYDRRAKGGKGQREFSQPGVEHDVLLTREGVAKLRQVGWVVDDGRDPETSEERRWVERVADHAEKEEAARSAVLPYLSPWGDYKAAFHVLRFGALTEENPRNALRELLEPHEEHGPVVEHVGWLSALRRDLEGKGWKFNFSDEPPSAREPSTSRGGAPTRFPRSLIRSLYRSFQLQYGVHGNQGDLRRYVSERLLELTGVKVSDSEIDEAVDALRKQGRR